MFDTVHRKCWLAVSRFLFKVFCLYPWPSGFLPTFSSFIFEKSTKYAHHLHFLHDNNVVRNEEMMQNKINGQSSESWGKKRNRAYIFSVSSSKEIWAVFLKLLKYVVAVVQKFTQLHFPVLYVSSWFIKSRRVSWRVQT